MITSRPVVTHHQRPNVVQTPTSSSVYSLHLAENKYYQWWLSCTVLAVDCPLASQPNEYWVVMMQSSSYWSSTRRASQSARRAGELLVTLVHSPRTGPQYCLLRHAPLEWSLSDGLSGLSSLSSSTSAPHSSCHWMAIPHG